MGLVGETNHAFELSRKPVGPINEDNLPDKPEGKQNAQIKSGQRKLYVIILCAFVVAFIIIIAVTTWYGTKSVNGSYSSWSEFGPCTRTCGGGRKERRRQCNNPPPKNGGKMCEGPATEIQSCKNDSCPVDGSYSSWSEFGPCTKSCEGGTKVRTRQCNNPPPRNGGKMCEGPATEIQSCKNDSCTVDGSYSSWSLFGPCTTTCGGGTMVRTRQCNNPPPQNGGKMCEGPAAEIQSCKNDSCTVDGSYSSWSLFGPCTTTCGGGTMVRTRQCNNPPPQNGGKMCEGPAVQMQFCTNALCEGLAGITTTQQFVQDIMFGYQTHSNESKQLSGRFQKSIFSMQRDAANEQAFDFLDTHTSRSRRDTDATRGFYSSYDKARTPSERLDDMKKVIKIAVNRTSKDFARSVFAKSLYVYIQKAIDEGVAIPEISTAAQGYLEWIKKDIGEQNFAELMLENGGATLMFTIDTTGSMSEEIGAAKAIATSIVNRQRLFPVDYILSPYNDPGTGPVTYKSPDGRGDFVTTIGGLTADGGGDCPELAFKGMIDAFKHEPQIGSPMFVFTDATPKDATASNIDLLKWYAKEFSATINFFFKSTCVSGIDASFAEIASYTSGQIFPLKTDAEIESFKDYVDDCLQDSVIIQEGKSGSDIFISIDGEIKTLLISLQVKQVNQAKHVKLVDPFGDVLLPSLTTSYTCIFKQSNPMPGIWHMQYPAGIEVSSYVAKSSGNNTVDFATYFLHQEKNGGPVLSVKSPVQDENSTAMLQISGADIIDGSSMKIDVLSEYGRVLEKDLSVKGMPGATNIFKRQIKTPIGKFKLQLKGTLKNGQNFTRTSQTNFKASKIVILTIRAGHDFTATVSNRTVPIHLYLFSKADKSVYSLSASSTYGSAHAKPMSFELEKGSNTTVTIDHTLPHNAVKLIGKLVTITLKVTMAWSSDAKEHQIKMMYVP